MSGYRGSELKINLYTATPEASLPNLLKLLLCSWGEIMTWCYSISSPPRIAQWTAVPRSGGKPCWFCEMVSFEGMKSEVEAVCGGTRRDSSEGELCRSRCWKWGGFSANQHLLNKLPPGFSKYGDNLVRTEPNRNKVGLVQAAIFLVVLEILKKKKSFFFFFFKKLQDSVLNFYHCFRLPSGTICS